MEVYTFRNRRRSLIKDACTLIHSPTLPALQAYTTKTFDEELFVRYETTLAFIHQFVDKLFLRDMHRVLRIIQVDGDFYKSQNRQEFVDSSEGVRGAYKQINQFDAEIAPGGAIGIELDGIRDHIPKRSLQLERLGSILESLDEKAEGIIEDFRANLLLFVSVIKGVLYGESGGRYDTLSNISYIGGSENEKLMGSLNRALKQAEEAQRIVNGLYDLERGVSD
jgi:hypothetical protein